MRDITNRPSPLPALLLGLSALLTACSQGSSGIMGASDEQAPLPVEVSAIERGRIAAVYSGTAALEAEREAEVVAKVGGEVEEILVEEGDRVEAGQVLARLDDDRLRLELERARANLAKLRNEYQRDAELHRKGLVTAKSFESVMYDIEALEAELALASLELSYTEIRAPISGVIAIRHIKVGNNIAANAPAFHIADLEPLVAYLHVPEQEFNKLAAGQEAEVRIDALGRARFRGQIARISPVIDPATGTFKVTVETDDPSGELKPGMFARFNVIYDIHNDAVLIPRSAILDDQAELSVFVVEDNTARRRTIRTGLTKGGLIEVVDGLTGGERIVTVGQSGLRDGGTVRVVVGPEPSSTSVVAAGSTTTG